MDGAKLYCVTGAAGHLGAAVVRQLLGRGDAVRALALPGEESFVPPGADVFTGNVLDRPAMDDFFRAADGRDTVLIHCAGIVTIAAKRDPRVWDVNVRGTQTVMAAARAAGVGRTVHVSTVHAIPEKPAPAVITETKTFSPDAVTGQYAKAKAAATAHVLALAADGMNVSVVHPSGILGPGDARGSNNSVRTVEAMAKGRLPASIAGGYDFVDVRDAADGILRCIERGRPGECYILSGRYATITELAALTARLAGRRPPRLTAPYALAKLIAPAAERLALLFGRKPVLTPYSVYTLQTNGRFSNEKAARELGYHPRQLEETLRDMLAEW